MARRVDQIFQKLESMNEIEEINTQDISSEMKTNRSNVSIVRKEVHQSPKNETNVCDKVHKVIVKDPEKHNDCGSTNVNTYCPL